MFEFISQGSAFLVFIGIAAVGFIFLLISLIFGEIFGHFDAAHDFDHGGPSFFSTRVMSVFITAFGGAGAVSTYYGLSPLVSSGVGFGTGVAFAWVIYAFARFLFAQQATTEVRPCDMAGRAARVVVAIPAGGIGQVRCQVGEELVDRIARSSDGAAIEDNAIVKIESQLGEVVIVSRP